jgi:hypothetical protein
LDFMAMAQGNPKVYNWCWHPKPLMRLTHAWQWT